MQQLLLVMFYSESTRNIECVYKLTYKKERIINNYKQLFTFFPFFITIIGLWNNKFMWQKLSVKDDRGLVQFGKNNIGGISENYKKSSIC
jgi:hypothetical protein